MSTASDPLVTVCRDPRDSARARVRLSALDGFAFDSFSHAGRSKFSRPMLVAHMAPAAIVDGELRRPRAHGLTPDRMKIAITRTHNQHVYPMLERMAAANRIAHLAPIPRRRTRLNAPPIPKRPIAPVVRSRDEEAPKTIDVAGMRMRSGLCLVDFAAYIGVTPAVLRNWEAGRNAPRAARRVLLAKIDRNLSASVLPLHPGATRHSG